jgi:hypothetical protein
MGAVRRGSRRARNEETASTQDAHDGTSKTKSPGA